MNAARQNEETRTWFRSDRVFLSDGKWFFHTREGVDLGPYESQFEAEIEAQEQGRVPQQFQRPVQEMPTPGRAANQAQDFWGSFSEMMDSSPENAWKYLSQAPQGALSAKMLVQDL